MKLHPIANMNDSALTNSDTFNILVATDNHLGYAERDAIRGNDSMTTFEEILKIAVEKSVDFILLGGDLFHENKPSRKCLHDCLEHLRKHCMGDRPIQFEFISDQSVNFKHNSFPLVNYEDPNLNISIPVFSIHGNHDDPAGSGSYCVLDLLSVSGLVNYFGKCTELQNVQISPLLMQKGCTKLALFGLGSIRDERLHRLFKENRISMLRPKEDSEEWFNLFVLHQNRAQHGPTNYIPANFLDEFLDLVIWGHEHECRITPEEVLNQNDKGFYISQPGSSIATSLSPGEAVPKHIGLLQIHKKKFKMTKIPLKTVRPFYIQTVNLAESGLNVNSTDISTQVMEYCKERVEALLIKAQEEQIGQDLDQADSVKPLIRLRVEYTDPNETFNTHRFGQLFLNRVANPKEILIFHKRRLGPNKKESDFDKDQFQAIFDASTMDKSRVEDLVKDYFDSMEEGELKLSMLSDTALGYAVKEFVDKKENHSIDNLIKHVMGKVKTHLKPLEITPDSINTEIVNFAEERNKDPDKEKQEIEKILSDSRKKTGNGDGDDITMSDEVDEDNEVAETSVNKTTRGRGNRARARGAGSRGGRGGRKKVNDDSDTDNNKPKSGRGSRGGSRATRGSAKSPRGAKNTIDAMFGKQARNGRPAFGVSDSGTEED